LFGHRPRRRRGAERRDAAAIHRSALGLGLEVEDRPGPAGVEAGLLCGRMTDLEKPAHVTDEVGIVDAEEAPLGN
jgi:hypothetical protein